MPFYFVRVIAGSEPASIGPYTTAEDAVSEISSLSMDEDALDDECIVIEVPSAIDIELDGITLSFYNAFDWIKENTNE